jgi:uncharacterized membrane protein YoaK (UPF0700 family)
VKRLAKRRSGAYDRSMTTRRILYGLAAMVALFIIGAIIGGVWDNNDTAGAITVTLWAISAIGAVVLLLALIVIRRRRIA